MNKFIASLVLVVLLAVGTPVSAQTPLTDNEIRAILLDLQLQLLDLMQQLLELKQEVETIEEEKDEEEAEEDEEIEEEEMITNIINNPFSVFDVDWNESIGYWSDMDATLDWYAIANTDLLFKPEVTVTSDDFPEVSYRFQNNDFPSDEYTKVWEDEPVDFGIIVLGPFSEEAATGTISVTFKPLFIYPDDTEIETDTYQKEVYIHD